MTASHTELTRLTKEHIPQTAAVAAQAFAADPMFTYIFPKHQRRIALLRRFMTAALRYGVLFGEVFTTVDGAGSALWLTPGQTAITPERMIRSGMAALPMTLGFPAFGRFMTFVQYGDKVHEQMLHEPHWYLLNLAVDPARHRQGIGSALIAPVLQHADRDQQACYLETNNPSNLPFYALHGFHVVHQGNIPNNGPPFWGLVRQPQGCRVRDGLGRRTGLG